MKKFLYPALALSALTLASCSSDEPFSGNHEGDAVFTVTLPGDLASRATLGDETRGTMDKLMWTIYEVNGTSTEAVATQDYQTQFGAAPFANSATTQQVTLNLGKGKTYKVVFFACNSANYGTDGALTFDEGVMTVNYDNIAGQTNDVNADAFTGVSVEVIGGNAVSDAVELTRPFAQLNWGTNDLDAQTVATYFNNDLSAAVTVEGDLYPSFDALNGTVTGTAVTSATFNAYTVKNLYPNGLDDADAVSFPVDGYNLVAMNYLLVGAEGTLNSCTLEFNNGFEPVEVNSVTVKQNYRTNIYGALLTNPTEFNVQIAPSFDGDENKSLAPWDGVSMTEVTPESRTIDGVETPVYVAAQPSDLAWLANQINSGSLAQNTYIELAGDMDMGNKAWTPISNVSRSAQATGFTGTFDGKGYTIKNLTSTATEDNMSAALIGVAYNANIKNVNIDGGTVTSADSAAGIVGYAGGTTTTISGCTVSNMKISGAGAAAGIVARDYGVTAVSDCTNNSEVIATGTSCKAGGIIGICSTGNGSTYTKCVNNGNVDAPSGIGNGSIGGVCGYAGSVTTFTDCVNNGTVGSTGKSINRSAGIVGYLNGAGPLTITGGENTGKVMGNTAGGAFGQVGQYGTVNIDGVTNSGVIEAVNTAGGIAGQTGDGVIQNCVNTAAITAGGIAGGVVGADNRGDIYYCQGGSAAITAPYAGRVLGSCNSGNPYRNVLKLTAEGNSYSDDLGTVGTMPLGTALGTLEIAEGELIGDPFHKAAGNQTSNSVIIIDEGATWNLFPENPVGTYRYSNGKWVKQ